MISPKRLFKYLHAINNIGEILLVLSSFQENKILEKWVLRRLIFNKVGNCAVLPSPDLLIKFCELFGLLVITKKNNREIVKLSGLGYKLVSKNYYADRLTKEQGIFLFSAILFNHFRYDILSTYNLFQSDIHSNIVINSDDIRIDFHKGIIIKLLQQLKLASFSGGNIIISKDDKRVIEELILPINQMNEEKLLNLLNTLRHNGKLAEDYVLIKEKEEFVKLGREDLAKLTQRISRKHVKAGYDILSFSDNNESLIYDKFIEVKGSVLDSVVFYITKNELQTAKELKEKYWIYYVSNVTKKNHEKMVKLQNPYYRIFKNKKNMVPILWRVKINDISKV